MLGFINVYKPSLLTSNAVLSKIKRQFGVKKIGHMGTLDPLAEGILPIAIGNATRMFDYFLNKQKTYIATFEFGYETDTLDSQGVIIKHTVNLPTKEQVLNAINSFIGVSNQMPPKYSAKNVNGKRAYDLAREGVEFELKPKEIEIFEFELLENISNSYTFKIKCSSGTYIRSIGRDLAYFLNSYATMTKLVRSESGKFNLDNAVKLDDLLNGNLSDYLINILDVFDYTTLLVNSDQANKLKNGMNINYKNNDEIAFVCCENDLLGVGIVENNKLKLKTHF